MKKFIIIFSLLLAGCATQISQQKIDRFIGHINHSQNVREEIFPETYNDVFLATTQTFTELALNIFRKDYTKGIIFATIYPEKLCGTYLAILDKLPGSQIKLTLKSDGFYIDNQTIIEKIKEQLEFNRLIK